MGVGECCEREEGGQRKGGRWHKRMSQAEQVMMRLRVSPGAGAAQVNGSRSRHLRAVMPGGRGVLSPGRPRGREKATWCPNTAGEPRRHPADGASESPAGSATAAVTGEAEVRLTPKASQAGTEEVGLPQLRTHLPECPSFGANTKGDNS